MPTPISIMLVGTEKYVRTVLANELRDHGHRVLVADTPQQAIEMLENLAQCEVTLLTFPMDGASGISVAKDLRDQIPGTRIGFLTEHVEFLIISGRADGFDVIDRTLPIQAMIVAIHAMATGETLTITPELRQNRIDEVLAKMAKAENVASIGKALKQRYEEVLKEPIPASIEEKLAELK